MVTRPNVDGRGRRQGTTALCPENTSGHSENEKGELVVDPLRCFEPVQLAEEWGDVVIPPRGKRLPGGGVNHPSWYSRMPTSEPLP